ncbi:hypothetical protein IMCC1989_2447 [gamma proteobacterium IMCC1989]|nr:hypothetical protein IMCC1989_2447 [gamma proteobacterium IMCC1989]
MFSLWSPSKGLLSQGSVTFRDNVARFSNAKPLNQLNRHLNVVS